MQFFLFKDLEGDGCGDLKEGGVPFGKKSFVTQESVQDPLKSDVPALQPETFGVVYQMGRGVQAGAETVGEAKGFEGGADAAFAVGAGDVETAQRGLGIVHFPQQVAHAVQLQFDVAGVFAVDVVEKFLILHMNLTCYMLKQIKPLRHGGKKAKREKGMSCSGAR